jgi:hypothetical protein
MFYKGKFTRKIAKLTKIIINLGILDDSL